MGVEPSVSDLWGQYGSRFILPHIGCSGGIRTTRPLGYEPSELLLLHTAILKLVEDERIELPYEASETPVLPLN